MSTTYRIPQKTSPEDKILGPFTIRDIVFLLIGGIFCYLVFSLIPINPLIEFTLEELLLIIGILGFISLILVIIKPEERGLELWLIDFLDYLKAPKLCFWKKEVNSLYLVTTTDEKELQNTDQVIPLPAKQANSDIKKIAQLSSLLDNPEQSLLEKNSLDVLDTLIDDEEIEHTKKIINDEKQETETNQNDVNINRERKQQSQELLKFLDDKKDLSGITTRDSEVLAKPDTGIKGFFSSFSRGLSSIFSKSNKKQDSSSIRISTKDSKKVSEPTKIEDRQNEPQKTEQLKSESLSTIDPSTSPERLFSELKNLKQKSQQKVAEQDNSATQQKPIKIISEADPLD